MSQCYLSAVPASDFTKTIYANSYYNGDYGELTTSYVLKASVSKPSNLISILVFIRINSSDSYTKLFNVKVDTTYTYTWSYGTIYFYVTLSGSTYQLYMKNSQAVEGGYLFTLMVANS